MDAPPVETFGDVLRRHRLAAGLTQEELAERAQVSPRAISDLERGARNRPYRETVQLLAAALKLGATERAELEVAARRPGPSSVDPRQREVSPNVVGSRTNLPTVLTRLIGREQETARTEELLRRVDIRLVTLTRPGGIGKTSLALQVAADLVDAFPGGVVFVPLAPIGDPSLVVSTIAQAGGVKESADQPLVETLKDALRCRPAGKLSSPEDSGHESLPASSAWGVRGAGSTFCDAGDDLRIWTLPPGGER